MKKFCLPGAALAALIVNSPLAAAGDPYRHYGGDYAHRVGGYFSSNTQRAGAFYGNGNHLSRGGFGYRSNPSPGYRGNYGRHPHGGYYSSNPSYGYDYGYRNRYGYKRGGYQARPLDRRGYARSPFERGKQGLHNDRGHADGPAAMDHESHDRQPLERTYGNRHNYGRHDDGGYRYRGRGPHGHYSYSYRPRYRY